MGKTNAPLAGAGKPKPDSPAAVNFLREYEPEGPGC